jgi:DNA-binding HxlR family transcriptional regulator
MMSRPTDPAPRKEARSAARSYPDPCGVARALNLIGERWALLVVRELLLGPKRFSDLRVGLPAISPNVLSQRLDELAERGLIVRHELGPPVSGQVYELTPFGATLEPLLIALATWGSRALPPRGNGELSTDALVLALRTTLRPDPGTTPMMILQVEPEAMSASRGRPTDAAQATITTDPATLRAVVFARYPVQEALETTRVRISGDTEAAHRFLTRFERPAPFSASPSTDAPDHGPIPDLSHHTVPSPSSGDR